MKIEKCYPEVLPKDNTTKSEFFVAEIFIFQSNMGI